MAMLKGIHFGDPDGEKEAVLRDDFSDFFYNADELMQKMRNNGKYFVLGSKGSGKTFLAECYKQMDYSESRFIEIISYKAVNVEALIHLKEKSDPQSEYKPFWDWVMLVSLCKMIVQAPDSTIPECREIVEFIDGNSWSREINALKIVEEMSRMNSSVTLNGLGLTSERIQKIQTGQYHEYISDLMSKVISYLSQSSTKFEIIFDNLDDRFSSANANYCAWIMGFISSVNDMNILFLRNKCNAKVHGLIRSDIAHWLNSPNLNRIITSSSFEINWGEKEDKSSPLSKMIAHKARISINAFKTLTDEKILSNLFKGKGSGPDSLIPYILERTRLRPRDVVCFLNLAKEKHGDYSHFSYEHFNDKFKSYSDYFLGELRNEMFGHIDDKTITKWIKFLKDFKTPEFELTDIVNSPVAANNDMNNRDVREMLERLYEFGAIINFWEENGAPYFSSSYRNKGSVVSFEKRIRIHKGLWRALAIG